MKKTIGNLALVLVTSLSLLGSVNSFAKDLKVGIVDVQAVARQLPQMADIEVKISAEFKEQVEELNKLQADAKYNYDKLQRESVTMSKAQQDELKKTIMTQQQTLEAKGKPLQQQMQRRGAEEQNKVLAMIEKAIEDEAKSSGLSVVFHKSSMAYSDPSNTDISDKVAERVKKIK